MSAVFRPYSPTNPADPDQPIDLVAALLAPASGLNINAFTNITVTTSILSTFFYDGSISELGVGSGLLLTTGVEPGNTNSVGNFGGDNGLPGDPQLDTVVPGAESYNATSLSFTYNNTNPNVTGLQFSIVFGSEEYPEYTDDYPDIGALFVNGVNYALFDDDPNRPLSVLTQNLDAFRNNAGNAVAPWEYDGISTTLTIIAPLVQGANQIRIAIADLNDPVYDSGMIIAGMRATQGTGGGLLVDIPGDGGDNNIQGGVYNENITGLGGNDTLDGGDGNDILDGGTGNDSLIGGLGDDTLIGGAGYDTMTGGPGADIFDFNSVSEIGMALNQRDVITDFEQGVDLLDLSSIDAHTGVAGLQHFIWLGTAGHTGAGATLRYQQVGANTLIYGDVNGDGAGDFTIQLNGLYNLQAGDFTPTTLAAVWGTSAGDVLLGGEGAELINGLGGNDVLNGMGGADTIRGGEGWDTLTGGAGADRFDFNSVAEIGMAINQRDVITDFEQGVDLIDFNNIDANSLLAGNQAFTWLGTAGHTGAGATLRYQHAGGNTLIYGDVNADGAGDFTLQLNGLHNLTAADFTALSINAIQGANGNDLLTGAPGGKVMLGLNGNDTIVGGAGADTIWGGAGADSMTGGAGADVFKWASHTHSGNAVGTRDIITDFQKGVDKLDLSGIDANVNVAGDQAFTFLGTAVHTGAGATLRYLQSGGNTLIFGDVDGDKAADFTIQLTGLYTLAASDFVL